MGVDMEFQFGKGFHSRQRKNVKQVPFHGSGVWSLVSRCVLIIFFIIILLPWKRLDFGSFKSSTDVILDHGYIGMERGSHQAEFGLLPLVFHDLKSEGLFKDEDRAIFLYNGDVDQEISLEINAAIVSVDDDHHQSLIPNESLDIVFTTGFHFSTTFVGRTLKTGGILVIPVGRNPNLDSMEGLNYDIVYIKRFESANTILAMKKTGNKQGQNLSPNRRLMMTTSAAEAKRKALSKLEDVLLEPPRAASRTSKTYLRRTRYLPDLMGESLDLRSYPRRVFIDVVRKPGDTKLQWFAENYPTRNLEFEMYKVIMENIEVEEEGEEIVGGISEWLRENVKEEEFVVMKAEAEVVEEMILSKAIKLVDELFLECKPKGLGFGGRKGFYHGEEGKKANGKAYWECLALYGKLRDEGVAVHQWWG